MPRRHGMAQQTEAPRVQRAPGDHLLQRTAQDAQILLRTAVLATAGVDCGKHPVALQQGSAALVPTGIRGPVEHAARPGGLKPVRE
ncbi:hypothetical protein AB0B21_33170 [Streptomyces rimosus]|uniref:hypothetical protein n=1 Tax=Streptomyces rimosus TaxID=1927 RepID=UPI000518C525|nr:hypothetical protein [Streptomyces rimosus]